MYGVLLFDDRQLIGTEAWVGRPLEGVITHVHNALIGGRVTRAEIVRSHDGRIVFRAPSLIASMSVKTLSS